MSQQSVSPFVQQLSTRLSVPHSPSASQMGHPPDGIGAVTRTTLHRLVVLTPQLRTLSEPPSVALS